VFFNKDRRMGSGAVMIALYMPNYPEIPHGVTRRGYLGMYLSLPDEDGIFVFDDVCLLPDGGKAEALFRQEPVMVNFRLGVMVGRIA
jgi:hypothetical protein